MGNGEVVRRRYHFQERLSPGIANTHNLISGPFGADDEDEHLRSSPNDAAADFCDVCLRDCAVALVDLRAGYVLLRFRRRRLVSGLRAEFQQVDHDAWAFGATSSINAFICSGEGFTLMRRSFSIAALFDSRRSLWLKTGILIPFY
jgi:hypothetical protein